MEILAIALSVFCVIAVLFFYLQMRKVGKMLGDKYSPRMDAALTMSVIIPFFLGFAAMSETLAMAAGIASVLSFSMGIMIMPGVLIEAWRDRRSTLERAATEDPEKLMTFEEKLRRRVEMQRAKRSMASSHSPGPASRGNGNS